MFQAIQQRSDRETGERFTNMKEIKQETKMYLVTARDNKGVQFWVSEKEYNEQVIQKIRPQSFEPVLSEGKNPEPVCKTVKSVTIMTYKMVDRDGGISLWVEAADVADKKEQGYKMAPGEVDPDTEKPYGHRAGVIERTNGR